MTNVLVVDSERSIRNTLKERLEYEGYRVETAETGGEAADKTEHSRFDVVLCDMAVPDIRAIVLLTSLHGSGKSTPFIMLSALKGLDPAIDSIRHGAFDYIPKPIDLNKLLRSIRSAVEDKSQNRATIETPSGKKSSAARAGDSARVVAKASCAPTEIVGTSVGIEHMKQLIEKVAPSDARVLITGDNGTGKELVAHRLHELSHRADRPFVEVNCAAIPSELIESELFGHEKGSFTSAIRMRKGKFEQADGGTLFLDEIGDMSLAAQAKVLRALQENRISRVGSDKDIEVDGYEQELAPGDRGGPFPRGLVSSSQRDRHSGACAPRTCRGHSAVGRLLHREDLRGVRHKAQGDRARGDRRAREDGMERQCPRVAQRDGTADYSQRANHFSRGCAGLCGGCAVRRSSYIFYKHMNIYFNKIYCEPSAEPTCSDYVEGPRLLQVESLHGRCADVGRIVQAG